MSDIEPVLAFLDCADAVERIDRALADLKRRQERLRQLRQLLAPPPEQAETARKKPPARGRASPEDEPAAGKAAGCNTTGVPGLSAESLERMARAIDARGPLSVSGLAEAAGVSPSTVYLAAKHPWLEKDADGYHLTQRCYAELLRQGE